MPTLAGLMDVARHDADLAFAGRDDAGAVRPNQARFRAGKRALDLDHVEHGHAFGDAHDEPDARVDRLEDRVGGEGRRHIDGARVGAGLSHRLSHGVEDGQPEMLGAALAGGHAADHARAIGDRLLGVEGALRAGDALADDARILIDEN